MIIRTVFQNLLFGLCVVCWTWAAANAQSSSAQADRPTGLAPIIRLGFIPGDGKAELQKSSEELSKLIESKTGIRVVPYVGTSYGDLIDKVAKREVDFAFLSALSYVEAESKVDLKVLLKKVWDKGFYYSVILVRADSNIRKISDLKGKRLGFVDKKSGSGALYPIAALNRARLKVPSDFKTVIYTGSHNQSVHALKTGAVDAVAIFSNDPKGKDSAWTQHGGLLKDVRVLWSSSAIPNDPLCVRADFYEAQPKLTHEFMFGLIELNEDSKLGETFRQLLGVKSLMTATSQQYEPVREMQREMKAILIPGESP